MKKNLPEIVEREIKLDNIAGKATVVVGPRRAGKTSVLKIVSREINGIYVDASGINS